MQLIISYLAADRLGTLEGLTASDISPMHDLSPVIAEMKKSIEPQVLEKLDDLLSEQKLVTNENGSFVGCRAGNERLFEVAVSAAEMLSYADERSGRLFRNLLYPV